MYKASRSQAQQVMKNQPRDNVPKGGDPRAPRLGSRATLETRKQHAKSPTEGHRREAVLGGDETRSREAAAVKRNADVTVNNQLNASSPRDAVAKGLTQSCSRGDGTEDRGRSTAPGATAPRDACPAAVPTTQGWQSPGEGSKPRQENSPGSENPPHGDCQGAESARWTRRAKGWQSQC